MTSWLLLVWRNSRIVLIMHVTSPNHWKDKRPQFHLCKSMAMYFWTNYSGFNGKIMGTIVVMPSWDVYLAYEAVKILATADLIL